MVKKAETTPPVMAATTLKGKIIEAGLEVGIIGKSGKNEAQNYKFTSEADVVMKVGPALFRRGVLVTPIHTIQSIVPYMSGRENNKQAFLTTVESMWTFADAESEEELVVGTVGQGTDTGGDKGVYKAMTGSKKYALLQALMIATGDDPEVARSDEKDEPAEVKEQDPDSEPTPAQIRRLFALGKKAGIAGGDMPALIKHLTGKYSSKQLKVRDLQGMFDILDVTIATGGKIEGFEPTAAEPPQAATAEAAAAEGADKADEGVAE